MDPFPMEAAASLRRRASDYRRLLHERYGRPYAFIHVPKTGGSSIERALELAHEHKTAIEKRDALGWRHWDHKFTFAVLRNPFDRAVSHYHWRVATHKADGADGHLPFPEWVRATYAERDPHYVRSERMFMPQAAWVADDEGVVLVDFLARLEQMEQDWDLICRRVGTSVPLPHDKKTERGDYHDYFDSVSKALVEEHYAVDLEMFGYSY